MRLSEWVKQEGRGAITRLSHRTGCSYANVHRYVRGALVKQYSVARKISDATGGAVSVAELCEAEPEVPMHG